MCSQKYSSFFFCLGKMYKYWLTMNDVKKYNKTLYKMFNNLYAAVYSCFFLFHLKTGLNF